MHFLAGTNPIFALQTLPGFSPGDWVAILGIAAGVITAWLASRRSVKRDRFDDLEKTVNVLNATVQNLQEDNERLDSKAEEAEKRADALFDQLEKSEKEIESLRCIVQERDEQLEAVQAALSAREVEIRQLREELNEAVSLREDRLTRIAELEAKTTQQEEEIRGLRTQVEDLKKRDTGELRNSNGS